MQTHLEGQVSVLAALRARQRRFEVILVKHDAPAKRVDEVLQTAAELGVPVQRVAGEELNDLANGATHGGVLAICGPRPRTSGQQLLDLIRNAPATAPPLLLILEGVDDSRNLGFTIRTAEAMGVTAVLVKKHLWDFDEAEVARPASGAYERLPLVQFEDIQLLRDLQKLGLRLYGCLPGARRALDDVPLYRPAMLAIGGEKRGLSGSLRETCDRFVAIPTAGGASSLSLSHAGAIVMAEAFRQRRAGSRIPAEAAGADQSQEQSTAD